MSAVQPSHCFTCGKILKWDNYNRITAEYIKVKNYSKGKAQDHSLDQLRYRRICCRRMFLSFPEETHKLLSYYKPELRQLTLNELPSRHVLSTTPCQNVKEFVNETSFTDGGRTPAVAASSGTQ